MPDNPLFKLVSLFYEVVPPVLKAGGKVMLTQCSTVAALYPNFTLMRRLEALTSDPL